MKSSDSLFTRQNPFQSTSRVGKTHYHPTSNQILSKRKKNTTLSPLRSKPQSSSQLHSRSRESQQPPDKLGHCPATSDEQPVFLESWPTSDCESSPTGAATSSDLRTPTQSAGAGKSTVSPEHRVQQDSVLAKYIERFRHGRPQSRELRQQIVSDTGEEQLSFWWMSPSSFAPSSTPNKTSDTDLTDDHVPASFSPAGQCRWDTSPPPCRRSPSILSDSYYGEFDTEVLHLQERASRLLLRGYDDHEGTLSEESIPVTSEGLGCSDFSSSVSRDEPVRPPLIPNLIKSTTANPSLVTLQAVSSQKSALPSMGPTTRPEEDILFQWRLRRKMEQARERSQSLKHSSLQSTAFSWKAPSLNHSSAGGQQHQSNYPPECTQLNTHPHTIIAPQPEVKDGHRPHAPVSGPHPSPVSQPLSIAHVPAHMHLLCDILPCPIQSTHVSAQQKISQKLDKVHPKADGNSADIATDEATREPISTPECASSRAEEEKWPLHSTKAEINKKEKAQTKESENSEKKTANSIRKHKKSRRYTVGKQHSDDQSCTKRSSSHQRLPKKVMSLDEQQQQQGSQGFSTESCPSDRAPPPSPIHSASRQIVSEVLFPTLDSSPAPRSPVSVSPPADDTAPRHSRVPVCNPQNSAEVISQLLQQAEDSDEKEFENDPLLQVLRKQRKWVKEQIREVNAILNESLDEQQVT
ncbi:proline and serine-rich protein 3 isoform X2 [Echeneis naucrates]|uniref:proline and serine-rich protein 3 isoform X2 n=1 Tax=Echeneis naucrates TaxID=173247 RepID=UPI0011134846|nr:proline and serine-rich protein 3 isoform X2 [Echeneis naucrates]